MVVLLEYELLGGELWARIRTSCMSTLGSTLKKMVASGSETLMALTALVSSFNSKVLFMTLAPGRGKKICGSKGRQVAVG